MRKLFCVCYDVEMTKSLNPILHRNMTSLLILECIRCNTKEYIIIITDVLFPSNNLLTNRLKIEHSQLNPFP